MQLSEEDFDRQFRETLDTLIESMADHSEVGVKAFYATTCMLENLSYFGPFLYGLLQKPKQ